MRYRQSYGVGDTHLRSGIEGVGTMLMMLDELLLEKFGVGQLEQIKTLCSFQRRNVKMTLRR